MKVGGGSGIFVENKSKRGVEKNRNRVHVEYSIIGCKVVTTSHHHL
jgi:hypothetical protein